MSESLEDRLRQHAGYVEEADGDDMPVVSLCREAADGLAAAREEIARLTMLWESVVSKDGNGTALVARCRDCRKEWPHWSVLSSFPVCESCREQQLAAERARREQAEAVLRDIGCSYQHHSTTGELIDKAMAYLLTVDR